MNDDPFLHPELTVPEQRTIADLAALERLSTQTLRQIILNAQGIIDRRQREADSAEPDRLHGV